MADLKAWLTSIGLERYAAAFAVAEVDLETLPHLTEDDLKDIGLPLGPRRRVLAARADPATAPKPADDLASASETHATSPERRQITVMFVDLVGSTRLSADVDPEVLAELLNGYKALVAREIVAAGGHVAKYLGDGVLAYFGWPRAREDAEEASIRCGLRVSSEVETMQAPDGGPLQCRIGVATGLVVVGGEAGEGAAREDAIAGEAPNLAARLQALAAPGAMVISESTHRRVGQLFECESLGDHAVSGFSGLVRAWRPLREAARASRFRGARAVRAGFVGREPELALLADRWRTAAEGAGRAVLILAEAGMGKSRLAEALQERISQEPHGLVIWQCSPYHQTKALYPVVEFISHAAGMLDADAPGLRLSKLAQLLGAARPAPERALPLFARLLAIPPEAGYAPSDLSPNQVRAATIAALSDWVRRMASDRPLLLLLEDAHWIDATTLELLTLMVAGMNDVPLLALVTARPEFVSPWSGRSEVSMVGLDRLSNRDCEGLVREAASAPLQDATVKEIVSRSDGNPLFLEELSAAVFEDKGSTGQTVPDSLQSSLLARLDQLGDVRRTAQVCSVLGRRFARPLLAQVAGVEPAALDANLAMLVEHDVIRPVGGAGEARYAFKHALVRDAAYESLLLSDRRRLHESCGRHLEQSFPEVARTEPELLAQHFGLAGLAGEAAQYAERAGDRAADACAFVEAIASYQEALRQTGLLPGGAERDRRTLGLLLKLGTAIGVIRGQLDPELDDIYRRAEALSRTVDDLDGRFRAVWGLWFKANLSRAYDDATTYAQQLVGISQQSGVEDHRLEALHCRWSSAFFRGDYPAGLADARRGTELYDQDRHHRLGLIYGGHDPGVCALCVQASTTALIGDPEAGHRLIGSAIGLAEKLEHPISLGHALVNSLILTTVLREPERLRPYAERLLELGRRFNMPPHQTAASYHLAWAEAQIGERRKGLEQMEVLFEQVVRVANTTMLFRVMFIERLLAAGRSQDALAVADKVVAELRHPDRGMVLPELYRLRGDCLAALGHREQAVAELRRAQAMADRDGADLLRLRAAASLYRVEPGDGPRQGLETLLAGFPADRTDPDLMEARSLLG